MTQDLSPDSAETAEELGDRLMREARREEAKLTGDFTWRPAGVQVQHLREVDEMDGIRPFLPEEAHASFESALKGVEVDAQGCLTSDEPRLVVGAEARRLREEALAIQEEHVLVKRGDASASQSPHILFAAHDTGAWAAIQGLVRQVHSSMPGSDLSLHLGGHARRGFEGLEIASLFSRVMGSDRSLYQALGEINDRQNTNHDVGIVIATYGTYAGPESAILYNAGAVYGAERLYLVADSWNEGFVLSDNTAQGRKELNIIDGIFVNDTIAKEVILSKYPEFDPTRVYVTGTGQSEPVTFAEAERHAAAGRKKLGLTGDETTVLLLNDSSHWFSDMEGVRPDTAWKTVELTAKAMVMAASAESHREFALLLRPHPSDPGHDKFVERVMSEIGIPPNMRVIDASLRKTGASGEELVIGIDEAAQAADFIASTQSTENNKARQRGKEGLYLTFEDVDEELGLGLLRKQYTLGAVTIQSAAVSVSGLTFVASPGRLTRILRHFDIERDRRQGVVEVVDETAADRILSIVMRDYGST